jgi:hypothetical protein
LFLQELPSNCEELKSKTADTGHETGYPRLEPLHIQGGVRQAINLDHAQNQNSQKWSQEELKYYEAVLVAEEARKDSEEPNPGRLL